ncbi:TPR domain-containing protein [Aromatoleum petrolei]|nr:TPR domain-containing protein [Aromatoleum petrolei]
MNEVRSSQTSLLSFLGAFVGILTALGAYLGFKTLPDFAKAHIEKELNPKLKELDERLRQLGNVDTKHDATLAAQRIKLETLQREFEAVRAEGQREIEKFKDSAAKSIRALGQGAFGDYLGIRASLLDAHTDEAKAMWRDSADWLSEAVKNASALEDESMQSWLWLNLAYSQKRSEQPTAALASAEAACGLGKPSATALYNTACYAALCADKPKLLSYLQRALELEPSISVTLRPNAEHNVQGEHDLRAYWEDPDLDRLAERFSHAGV